MRVTGQYRNDTMLKDKEIFLKGDTQNGGINNKGGDQTPL